MELESGIDDLFLNFYAMRDPDQWIPLEMEDPATEAHNGYAAICNRSHGLADDYGKPESLDGAAKVAIFQAQVDWDRSVRDILGRPVLRATPRGIEPDGALPGG